MIYVNAKQDTISTEFIHQYSTQDRLHVPFITPKLCGVISMMFFLYYLFFNWNKKNSFYLSNCSSDDALSNRWQCGES